MAGLYLLAEDILKFSRTRRHHRLTMNLDMSLYIRGIPPKSVFDFPSPPVLEPNDDIGDMVLNCMLDALAAVVLPRFSTDRPSSTTNLLWRTRGVDFAVFLLPLLNVFLHY